MANFKLLDAFQLLVTYYRPPTNRLTPRSDQLPLRSHGLHPPGDHLPTVLNEELHSDHPEASLPTRARPHARLLLLRIVSVA